AARPLGGLPAQCALRRPSIHGRQHGGEVWHLEFSVCAALARDLKSLEVGGDPLIGPALASKLGLGLVLGASQAALDPRRGGLGLPVQLHHVRDSQPAEPPLDSRRYCAFALFRLHQPAISGHERRKDIVLRANLYGHSRKPKLQQHLRMMRREVYWISRPAESPAWPAASRHRPTPAATPLL